MNTTAVVIVAIICWCIVSLVKHRAPNKKFKETESRMQQENAQIQQDLENMAKRLAVLEKIVTDQKYDLNKEFESLKD